MSNFPDTKKGRLKILRSDLFTVQGYVTELELTVDEYNDGRVIPITHILELEFELGGDFTQTGILDVGKREGVFYICAGVD